MMVRQQGQDLCTACSNLDDPLSTAQSKGSSRGASRSTPQASSRYVEGYEPEAEYGMTRRSHKGMIDELSMRLSEPREHSGQLSSGESIMADTIRKSRTRAHDRDRIDDLAAPNRQASTCASWRCPPPDPLGPPPGEQDFFPKKTSKLVIKAPPLSTHRLDDLLSRLAAPRQRPPVGGNIATGEKIILEAQGALKSKAPEVCMKSLTARLSNPRVPDPSVPPPSGEAVTLEHHARIPRRAPNLDYLKTLARPNRRGGSAHAWRAMITSSEAEGGDKQALGDDRTATPLSMRTTSPPHLNEQQESETSVGGSNMKLLVGTDDDHHGSSDQRSSQSLKDKIKSSPRSSQGKEYGKKKSEKSGSDSHNFKIFVGDAES